MAKILVGVAVGIASVIAACGVILVVFTGPELSVQVSAPSSVPLREPFQVALDLSNPHDEVITFDSIDVDDGAFQVFGVASVTPEPSEGSPVGGFGYQTWFFDLPIAPGSTQRVEFELTATSAGLHQIPFDVCNAYQDCSRIPISIQVSDDAR